MEKRIINFGYNNYDELKDYFTDYEGSGEYIDAISINKINYLITKIDEKIDVREIIEDYISGNTTIYANQEKSEQCLGLEKIFNNRKFKDCPIFYILSDLKISAKRISISSNVVVCIKPEVFSKYMKLLNKYQDKSFLDICKQLEEKQLSNDNETFKYGFNY